MCFASTFARKTTTVTSGHGCDNGSQLHSTIDDDAQDAMTRRRRQEQVGKGWVGGAPTSQPTGTSLFARPWPSLTSAICNLGLVRRSTDDVGDDDNGEDSVAAVFIVVVAVAVSQVGDQRSSPWHTQAHSECVLGVPSTSKYLALVAPTSIDIAAVTCKVRRRCSDASPLVRSGPVNWPATCSACANPRKPVQYPWCSLAAAATTPAAATPAATPAAAAAVAIPAAIPAAAAAAAAATATVLAAPAAATVAPALAPTTVVAVEVPAATRMARTATSAAAVTVAVVVAVVVAMYCTDRYPKSTYDGMKFLCTDSEWALACGMGHISHEFFYPTLTLNRRNPLL